MDPHRARPTPLPLSPSPSRGVLVLSALVIGIVSTLILTAPQRQATPASEIGRTEVSVPSVAPAAAPPVQDPTQCAQDWTQSLAAPLLYLDASDYPSTSGPEGADNATTWLHDRGVRSLLARTQGHYGLAWIESQVGEAIFLSGPHHGAMNFASASSFGHYNPRFFVAAQAELERLTQLPGFIAATRSAFQTNLQRQIETYLAAERVVRHDASSRNDRLASEYAAHVRRGTVPDMFLQEAWRSETQGLEARGADWYEANTALGFWTRRTLDGSADEINALMHRVLEVYDLPALLHVAAR